MNALNLGKNNSSTCGAAGAGAVGAFAATSGGGAKLRTISLGVAGAVTGAAGDGPAGATDLPGVTDKADCDIEGFASGYVADAGDGGLAGVEGMLTMGGPAVGPGMLTDGAPGEGLAGPTFGMPLGALGTCAAGFVNGGATVLATPSVVDGGAMAPGCGLFSGEFPVDPVGNSMLKGGQPGAELVAWPESALRDKET
jgi:hypothetical protein